MVIGDRAVTQLEPEIVDECMEIFSTFNYLGIFLRGDEVRQDDVKTRVGEEPDT